MPSVGAASGLAGRRAQGRDRDRGRERGWRHSCLEHSGPPRQRGRGRTEAVRKRPQGRRLTWRVLLFSLILLALVGGAFYTIQWYGRSTYFVGFEGDRAAIFKGRPGGVLWLNPVLEETTDIERSHVPADTRDDLEAGKEQSSLADAHRYVDRLSERRRAGRRDDHHHHHRPAATTSAPRTTTTRPRTTTYACPMIVRPSQHRAGPAGAGHDVRRRRLRAHHAFPDDSPIPNTTGPFLAIIVGLPLWPTSPSVAWRRRPTACSCHWRACSTGWAVFIVRIDEARASLDGLAGLSIWMILGVGAFIATLMIVRDVRMLERYRYTAGFQHVLLLLPLVPVLGRTINGSKIWVSIGPSTSSRRVRQAGVGGVLRRLLWEKRELAINRAYGPFSLPDPCHLGPVLLARGVAGGHGVGARPGVVAAVLHAVPGPHLGRHRAGVVPRRGAVRRGRGLRHQLFGHVQERVDVWFDPGARTRLPGGAGGFAMPTAASRRAGVLGLDQDPGGRETT